MALHSFDPEIAKQVGVNAATIYQNLIYWQEKNEANERHFYEGKYWTYNSLRAFTDLFPYLSADQIRTAIQKLVDADLIEVGEFNKSSYDRTKWYCVKSHVELGKIPNGEGENPKPIPDSKPNIKPNISGKILKERDQYNKPDQPTFKRFMAEIWPHRWKDGDDRKPAYFAYLKLDAAQRDHCAAVIAQAKRELTSQFENQYRKAMSVWLKANGWEKYAAESKKPDTEIDWAGWMQLWRESRTWHPSLGPEPGYAGCKVPNEFLQSPPVKGAA